MDPGVCGEDAGQDPGGTLGAEGGVEFLLPLRLRFFLEGLWGPGGREAGGVVLETRPAAVGTLTGRGVPVETRST